MTSFRSFSKSAFWSQFLLGIVAIFALPALAEDKSQMAIADQQIVSLQAISTIQIELEQPYFIQFEPSILCQSPQQAVVYCLFFAKAYRLLPNQNPPIRAGPLY